MDLNEAVRVAISALRDCQGSYSNPGDNADCAEAIRVLSDMLPPD